MSKTRQPQEEPKWTFHLHFPLLSVWKNCRMVWNYSLLLTEKEQWMKDLEDFKNDSNKDQRHKLDQLDLVVSSPGYLIRMGENEMDKLTNKLREDQNFQHMSNILKRLQLNLPKLKDESFFDTSKWVTKSVAIQMLIETSLKLKETEIFNQEIEVATFNLNEGLLEAAPQALLQSSIQMRDGKFFNRKSTAMEMVTVILSLISMSFASGTM